jgi:hypothetical protein
LAHSLLKDDRIPSACEEDINVWLAMTMMMYLTEQAVYMGSAVLVRKGTTTVSQLGSPKLLHDPGLAFDEDVLEIHHAVPSMKMEGFGSDPMPYQLGHFTRGGLGDRDPDRYGERRGPNDHHGPFQPAGRPHARGPQGDSRVRVPRNLLLSAIYIRVDGGARELRQALAKGCYGHHLAVAYGDHVDRLAQLGEVVGFDIEIHR